VVDLTLDQALPVAQDLAGRKANAFVRRCGLGSDEREDVESQLVLIFLARWPKFDSERASVRTFASRVMDKELTSILRYRLAEGRRPQDLPSRGTVPSDASLRQFQIDLDRAVAPLPSAVQATALALFWCTTVETAEALGCSRQMISRRKQQIREAFLSVGIGPNYFVAGGSR
jgi:DNA-directed RNA polymerase specialized sigma24 family protein